MSKADLQNRLRHNAKLKKILIAMFMVAVFYGLAVLGLRAIGLENLHTGIKQLGVWAPLVFVLLCAIGNIFAPLSATSLYITGGILFGQHLSILLSFVGLTIGCCVNFWISRKFGRRVAARLIGHSSLDDLDRFTGRLNSRHSILFMIGLLALSQDLVSYAIGLTDIKFWHFFTAMLVTGIVTVAAYVYLGSGMLEALV